IFDELRLDFVGENFADPRVLFDVRPFRDQKETLRILRVTAQHAVLHLRPGLVHGIAVRIIEFLKRADELLLFSLDHAKIINVQKVALRRERFLRHGVLLLSSIRRYADEFLKATALAARWYRISTIRWLRMRQQPSGPYERMIWFAPFRLI